MTDLMDRPAIVDDAVSWKVHTLVEKWDTDEDFAAGLPPVDTVEDDGNLLMFGGASCLWQCLLGNGSAAAGGALTYFNAANAALGVGDSTTAPAGTQTNLQAATNRLRKTATPTHTDGVVAGSATITYVASFAAAEANYVWNEWGLFNSATDATGRMLSRKVPGTNLGTKTGGTWQLTITITLS